MISIRRLLFAPRSFNPGRLRGLVLAAVLLAGPGICAADQPTAAPAGLHARFHVDPINGDDGAEGAAPARAFRSFERARAAVHSLPAPWTGDVEIVLHGERLALRHPITLGTADSGRDGFHLRLVGDPARPGGTVLDGGVRITGWTVHDRAQNIWRAPAPAGLESRQLFVNGVRATRARSVSGIPGMARVEGGYTVPADSGLGLWKNPDALEFVNRNIWTSTRVGVRSIETQGDKVMITMRRPAFPNARNKGVTSIDLPWYLENAYELLDEPGEWYLDRSGAVAGGRGTFLYYKPHDWEDVRRAEFVMPALEQLVVLRGDSIAAPVQNIVLSNLGFEHTTWLRPNTDFGQPDAQNNVMRENFDADDVRLATSREFVPEGAAILGKYARGITVERSRFARLGGLGAFLGTGAQDSRVIGNSFHDIAGTGIQLGDYLNYRFPDSEDYAHPTDPRLLIARNEILNNHLNRCGVEFRSSVAIGISFPRESRVAHNEILNLPYSGMHFGWAWTVLETTAMGANLIERNLVQNTMVELADGGAIYFLGRTDPALPPTILRHNYSLRTRWGQGFYFDEASNRYLAENNRFEHIGDANIKINGKNNADIRVTGLYADKTRNLVSKGLDRDKQRLHIDDVLPFGVEPHRSIAREIRENAGLEPAFRSIRPVRRDVVTHELEDGDMSGPATVTTGMDVRPFVTGYSGMAYVDGLASAPGGGATVTVHVTQGGDYDLRLRYAAQNPVAGLDWRIDDHPAALGTLPATGDRSTWSVVTTRVILPPGETRLTLASRERAEGFFLADRVDVVPASRR